MQSLSDSADPKRVRGVLGQVHLVNPFSGKGIQRFSCYRCKRNLPENQFAYLGPRFLKSARGALNALHPFCHVCRGQLKGRWTGHPLYTPKIDRFWKDKFSSVRSQALNRSIFLGIDYEDLLGRYLEQDGRCALSGLEMKPFDDIGSDVKSGRNLARPSVDRIDSRKHYTPDNIQIIMASVNIMKGELPQDVFIEFCQQISNYQLFR